MKLVTVGLISLAIFSTGTFAKAQLPVSAHNCKIVKTKLDGMLEREKVGSSTPAHAKRLRTNIEMFAELKAGCVKKGLALN
jgi:hypothetical protein